jgi:mRNA interferase MazF
MVLTEVRRGEVWLISLGAGRKGEPGRNRPGIIVSVDDILAGVETELVVVVPLSRSRAMSPLRPAVSPEEGADAPSVAVCRGIRAVTRTRLLRRLGVLQAGTLTEVERALAMVLGIDRVADRGRRPKSSAARAPRRARRSR